MGVEAKEAQLYLGSELPSSDALSLCLLLVVFRASFHETCRSGKIAFLLDIRTAPAFIEVFALEVMHQRVTVSAVWPG